MVIGDGDVSCVPGIYRPCFRTGVSVFFVPDPADIAGLSAALIALSGSPLVRIGLHDADTNASAERAGEWLSHRGPPVRGGWCRARRMTSRRGYRECEAHVLPSLAAWGGGHRGDS